MWLTAATRNAHFLDKDNQALAYRRLAQVYFEWGAIDDVSNDVTYSRETIYVYFRGNSLLTAFAIGVTLQIYNGIEQAVDMDDTETFEGHEINTSCIPNAKVHSFHFY